MSTDRITQVDVFPLDSGGAKRWVYVKLTTADGVEGWGECYTAPNREQAIAVLAQELGAYLIDRDIFSIKHFTTVAYLDIATKRGSMEFFCALSGLEAAMWDIVGKTLDQPIYNLLGGPSRTRIRVYANGWSYGANGEVDETIEATVAHATALVAAGFDALKFDPFPGRWRVRLERRDERRALDCVRALRDAVGPDVDLLIEGHRRFSRTSAKRLALLLEEFDPFWFEEPVPSSSLDDLAEIAAATSLPVVTGEDLYTKHAFRDVFAKRAAGIVNPDVANCGGILELLEIGAMAASAGVAVAPHNYNSTGPALAATLHAAAVMPNFLITEYFVNFAERTAEIVTNPPTPDGGYIDLPTSPGLGIEINEARLRELTVTGPAETRLVATASDER
jgi:galactonate dehydratase